VANGVLAAGASPGSCRIGHVTGSCNLYLDHDGVITFVAHLVPGNETTVGKQGESEMTDWAPTSQRELAGSEESTGRVSPDGRTVLFRSTVRLTGYHNEGQFEIYRYRVGGTGPICVSCNPTGSPPTGSAALQDTFEPLTGPKLYFAVRTRNLSASGDRVFFETPDPLVVNDVNGVDDVYEWEAEGTGSCVHGASAGGCLYLISGGDSSRPSHFADASVSGDDAFFFTSQPLASQDRDELVDVYDARLGGGIAAQNEAPPLPCEGEAGCRPPANAAPAVPAPASAGFSGPGNPKPRQCRKGLRRVLEHGKEKCVKPHRHRKKQGRHRNKPANHATRNGGSSR
jgi:hypothetical protein